MYVCAVTGGQSFIVLSVWGVLISFWSVLVFSPTLLSLFIIITLLLLSLLLLLLLVITVIIISTELLALCDGCLGWGWVWQVGLVAGLRVGQACGVLLLPGFGVSSSSPQVPGHPTSICNAGVNPEFAYILDSSAQFRYRCMTLVH